MPVVPALRAIMATQTGDEAWLHPRAPLVEINDPRDLDRCRDLGKRLA
jgi:hypothetical protein